MAHPSQMEAIKIRVSATPEAEVIEMLTNEINRLTAELNLAKHTEQHLHSAETQIVKLEEEITLVRKQLQTALAARDSWKEFSKVKVEQAKETTKRLLTAKADLMKAIVDRNYWEKCSKKNYAHMCELLDDNAALSDEYDEMLTKRLSALKTIESADKQIKALQKLYKEASDKVKLYEGLLKDVSGTIKGDAWKLLDLSTNIDNILRK